MAHLSSIAGAPERNYRGPSRERVASALPEDAHAVIEPWRGAWRLRFRQRQPHRADPLTGWAGGADTLTQVEIGFPDAASAIRYAERHDLSYELREVPRRPRPPHQRRQDGSLERLCCWPTGPHARCCGEYPVLKEQRPPMEGAPCRSSTMH